jgi:tetratricopeptide (TPR) repeat protein
MTNQRSAKLVFFSNLGGKLLQYLLVIILIGSSYADTQAGGVDSLLTLLSSTKSDAKRIILMNELSSQLKNIDLKESLTYAQKSLQLAKKIDNKKATVEGLLIVGIILYETSDRDSALAYFEQGEDLAEQLGFKKLQVDNLIQIAKWYRYYQIDSTKAVNTFFKSMEVSKSANYHEGTGRSYAKLASFYTKYKEIELCEKYLQLSADYYIQIENGAEEIAHYYNEIGDKVWDFNPKAAMDFYLKGMEYFDTYPNLKVNLARVHSLIDEPEVALKYLNEAFSYIDTFKQKRMLGIAYSQLVEVYIQLKDFQSAEKVSDKGIALLTPLGRSNKRALPSLYRAKGVIAEHAGDDETALMFYKKGMDEAVKIRFGFDRLRSQLAIGVFYLDKDLKKSKNFCSKSYNTARKNKYTSIEVEACDCLYNVYKKSNSTAKALMYYEQKITLSDSLNMLSVKHTLEINSKISKKDKQLAEQAYQKEIKDAQLQKGASHFVAYTNL